MSITYSCMSFFTAALSPLFPNFLSPGLRLYWVIRQDHTFSSASDCSEDCVCLVSGVVNPCTCRTRQNCCQELLFLCHLRQMACLENTHLFTCRSNCTPLAVHMHCMVDCQPHSCKLMLGNVGLVEALSCAPPARHVCHSSCPQGECGDWHREE